MIVRETESEFVMIPQHEHAQLSGVIAEHFSQEVLQYRNFLEEFKRAVFEHDRSWICLDKTPIWNDQSGQPYSFMDYPLLPKIALYEKGLDEIESMSKFACLLCSLHYSSFFTGSSQKECIGFMGSEFKRQERIKKELQINNQDMMIDHFLRLLKFCDQLSLYVCLNHPGTDKDHEHSWYQDGFPNSAAFSADGKLIQAEWKSMEEIHVLSFPFTSTFSAGFMQKRVSKHIIQQLGIAEAYEQTEIMIQEVTFRK